MSENNEKPKMTEFEVNQNMFDQYLKRINQNEKLAVAMAVNYLLRPQSSFLNGINLIIDCEKTV